MQRGACREGRHAFGAPTEIGAGLIRTSCKYCSEVVLDLREPRPAKPTARAASRFFGAGRRLTIFEIGQAAAAGLYDVTETEESGVK